MNDSTSSLALTDGSQLSITESETANSRHGYNTRYSTKLKSQASSNSVIPNASTSTTRNKRRSNLTPFLPQSAIKPSNPLVERIESLQNSCAEVVMRRNFPGCNQEVYNQWGRLFRYAIIFFAMGSVVLICSYLGHSFSDSRGSVDCVKQELKTFKADMADLKEEVQDIIANREQTNRKLEVIQDLLKDLKSNHDIFAETQNKCQKNSMQTDMDDQKTPNDITNALNKYDADKTGKTDFALESAGGSIVTIRNTENYPSGDTVKFFGIPLCPASNGPRTMIQPGNLPGECWAFKGSEGEAVIQLLGKVRITSVSVEHIQKAMSPSGEISTAPKDFSITGLKEVNDKEGQLLGKFVYNQNGPPIQEFKTLSAPIAFSWIEFKVHSNNGNPDFTCVYRLRVHGRLEGKRI